MEYTIQKMARLAGVSTRTLRYYDQIALLKPARINSSGYRIYGPAEVDLLQQILFYRELDLNLEQIKGIIHSSGFDPAKALAEHRLKLIRKREQLDSLIANVEKTIGSGKGKSIITDREKFEGFKKKLIEDNEARYGSEVRSKYGDEKVDQANQRIMKMSEKESEAVALLAEEIFKNLDEAFKTGDPSGPEAQKTADLHRQWLTFFWGGYSKEGHSGLAEMYVDDERFRAYYDRGQPGKTEFLRDAILIYTGSDK